MDRRTAGSLRRPVLADPAKGVNLLWGTLVVLAGFSLIEAVILLWKGRVPTLLEVLAFALLATDGLILLSSVHRPANREGGWLGLLDVWILGLIPYFVWALIYALGRRFSAPLRKRSSHALRPALAVWALLVLFGVGLFLVAPRVSIPRP